MKGKLSHLQMANDGGWLEFWVHLFKENKDCVTQLQQLPQNAHIPLSLNYRPGKEGRVPKDSPKDDLWQEKPLSCSEAVFETSCASRFPADGEMGSALVLTGSRGGDINQDWSDLSTPHFRLGRVGTWHLRCGFQETVGALPPGSPASVTGPRPSRLRASAAAGIRCQFCHPGS